MSAPERTPEDTCWMVWMRWSNNWCSLPYTAATTRQKSIALYSEGFNAPEREWRRQRRAGDVSCRRTLLTAPSFGDPRFP